jgi:hypothetical protein
MMIADPYDMHRTRVIHASHPEERLAMTARFILGCQSLAKDLQRFADMRRQGVEIQPEGLSAERYIDDQIRSAYRSCFGAELGGTYPEHRT